LHTLNLSCSIINVREPCNNQRPRCDIVCLHVTNHLYHGFPSQTIERKAREIDQEFKSENRGINII